MAQLTSLPPHPEAVVSEFHAIYRVDAFDWLAGAEADSIHAVVTDPPYGLVEYTDDRAPSPAEAPSLMRQIVHAALPMGEGVVLDPFMGAGATIAAADALGLRSVGLEISREFFAMAVDAIPRLSAMDRGA